MAGPAVSSPTGTLLRRLALGCASLALIIVATFFLMHSIPGGPFDSERVLPPAIERNIRERYGLGRPVAEQFFLYIGEMVRGDLGTSLIHDDRSVAHIIRTHFPRSALIGGCAFLLAALAAVPLGTIAAARRGGMTDRTLLIATIAGVSAPSFIIASLLQYVVSYRLGWAPAAGWGESPWQVALPALALAGFPLAFLTRLVRASLLDVLASDYVRTARAKGLSAAAVVVRHGLRNALLPAVTYAGPILAGLLTGSFVVETIFAVPGLGSYYVSSIYDRDYPVIMGVTIFYSALLIGLNLLIDGLYLVLDPRLREP